MLSTGRGAASALRHLSHLSHSEAVAAASGGTAGSSLQAATLRAGLAGAPEQRLSPEHLQQLLRSHLDQAQACAASVYLAKGVLEADRRAISAAITLCESTTARHHAKAANVLHLVSHGLASRRHDQGAVVKLGVSGPPGAGKSTLIEALGMRMLESASDRVAVLAIDPTSQFSGGAILGDKTRMQRLSSDDRAFVRPSPTRGSLGGVTRSTADAMVILQGAGYPKVLIETVGVGQSETAVADLVDCVLLVLPPSGGDDLQAMKRGIMEVADIVVVNKADGETEKVALRSARQHSSTLGIMPRRWRTWTPEVLAVSATTGRGLEDLLDAIRRFHKAVNTSGELQARRRSQQAMITQTATQQLVLEKLQADSAVQRFLGLCSPGKGVSDGLSARCIAHLAAETFLSRGDSCDNANI